MAGEPPGEVVAGGAGRPDRRRAQVNLSRSTVHLKVLSKISKDLMDLM